MVASSPKTTRPQFWLRIATFTMFVLLIVAITLGCGAANLFFASGLTPTVIPPDALTQSAQDNIYRSQTQTALSLPATQTAQAQQARQLTLAAPTLDPQGIFPIFSNTPPSAEEILKGKSDFLLAGYGILYVGQAVSDRNQQYRFNNVTWQETTVDSMIWAMGGRSLASPDQGAIRIMIAPHDLSSTYQNDAIIESPVQAGELTITGALGERLILTSQQGQTFYFDIPALRFVDGLREKVPAATPAPTLTAVSPAFQDDAPDEPRLLSGYPPQLEDKDLNHYINSPTDYDWFTFVSQAEGKLKVSLVPRGNNYGLRVVLVDPNGNGTVVGEDTSSGGRAKQVIVPNAPRGNYMVRVWSLDGSYNAKQAYTLHFAPPKPQRVTPIIECVAENPDGTFTAHFGYDNPNPYVIVIDSRHQNTFHPGPAFRTGQPEHFAPGRVTDFFVVLFDGNPLTWRLGGKAATATRHSPRCP